MSKCVGVCNTVVVHSGALCVLKEKNGAKINKKAWRKDMLKGAQKKMIVIKTSDSEIFEEAYFVVKGGVERSQPDMVSEANRIIEGCGEKRRERKSRDMKALIIPLISFMAGTIFGGGIAILIAFVSL